MNTTSAAVYYLLNILLFPITLIGYVLMSVSFIAGRKSGVSRTARAPLLGRWLLHNLGSRQDEPANRLMMAMAGLSVSLTEGPMIFAHRVAAMCLKLTDTPSRERLPWETRAVPDKHYSTALSSNTSPVLPSS
jgi:hypothetical protein